MAESRRPQIGSPRHLAWWLYLGLAALAIGLVENELQAVATDGPSALDLEHLRGTWLGSLALAYPFVFWPVVVLVLAAAVFGFVIDRRVKHEDADAPFVRVRNLPRDAFPMGDTIAAEFPYQIAPVREAYSKALAALIAAAGDHPAKRGVLVLGKANTGKTRLAYEALTHALPNWWVLKGEPAQQLADLPTEKHFAGRDVVIVVDDAQDYAGRAPVVGGTTLAGPAATLQTLWSRAKGGGRHAVLVATCRQEPLDEGRVRPSLPWLFSELDQVTLPVFDQEDAEGKQVQATFEAEGAPSAEDFDGTLGSLVLGMAKKKAQYDELRRTPAGSVLRGMKLLDWAGIRAQTERRVRAAARCVSGDIAVEQDAAVWNAALDDLTRTDFIRVTQTSASERRLEIRKTPTYFDDVVTDYPNPALPGQIDGDRATLMGALEAQGDAEALRFIERYIELEVTLQAMSDGVLIADYRAAVDLKDVRD